MVDVVALAVPPATDIGMILMDGTLFKSLFVLALVADRISSGGEDEADDDEVDADEEVGLFRNAATLNAFRYHVLSKSFINLAYN